MSNNKTILVIEENRLLDILKQFRDDIMQEFISLKKIITHPSKSVTCRKRLKKNDSGNKDNSSVSNWSSDSNNFVSSSSSEDSDSGGSTDSCIKSRLQNHPLKQTSDAVTTNVVMESGVMLSNVIVGTTKTDHRSSDMKIKKSDESTYLCGNLHDEIQPVGLPVVLKQESEEMVYFTSGLTPSESPESRTDPGGSNPPTFSKFKIDDCCNTSKASNAMKIGLYQSQKNNDIKKHNLNLNSGCKIDAKAKKRLREMDDSNATDAGSNREHNLGISHTDNCDNDNDKVENEKVVLSNTMLDDGNLLMVKQEVIEDFDYVKSSRDPNSAVPRENIVAQSLALENSGSEKMSSDADIKSQEKNTSYDSPYALRSKKASSKKKRKMSDSSPVSYDASSPVFKCEICQIFFISEDSLRSHYRLRHKHKIVPICFPPIHISVKATCGICSQTFSSKKELVVHAEEHIKAQRVALKKTNFSCRFCRKSFLSLHNLLIHLDTHAKEQTPTTETNDSSSTQHEE